MTNNLKIEVLVSNIPEDGSIASQFPSQEYVNQQLAKKANLSPEGRLDPSHAPDYTEIPGLYEHIEDTKDAIETSIADSLQDAKGYTNQQLSTSLQTKADLVNGKIPFDQIPFSADIEDQIQINVENITAVVDQKVAQVVEQVNGVATAANRYTDTKVAETKKYVDTTVGNVIEDVTTIVDTKAVSKAVTIPTYLTPEAGVAAGTGVAAGAYYNVRSTEDATALNEYQNIGGVPTPSGKSYPSSVAVRNIAKYTALPFVTGETYGLHERVQLENGDRVQSTVPNNIIDPNVDMTGWKIDSINYIESISNMLEIENKKDGDIFNVLHYDKSTGRLKGGGLFIYDSSKVGVNDGGVVIDGCVRQLENNVLNPYMFGAYGDFIPKAQEVIERLSGHDDSLAFQNMYNMNKYTIFSNISKMPPSNVTPYTFEWANAMFYIEDTLPVRSFQVTDCMNGKIFFNPIGNKDLFTTPRQEMADAYAVSSGWNTQTITSVVFKNGVIVGNVTGSSTTHAQSCFDGANPYKWVLDNMNIERFAVGVELYPLDTSAWTGGNRIGNFYENELRNVSIHECIRGFTNLANATSCSNLTVVGGYIVGVSPTGNCADYYVYNAGVASSFSGFNIAPTGQETVIRNAVIYDACHGSSWSGGYTEWGAKFLELDPSDRRFVGFRYDASHAFNPVPNIVFNFKDGVFSKYNYATETRTLYNNGDRLPYDQYTNTSGIQLGAPSVLIGDFFKFCPQYDFKFGAYGMIIPNDINIDVKRFESTWTGFTSEYGLRICNFSGVARDIVIPISNKQTDVNVCILYRNISGMSAENFKLNVLEFNGKNNRITIGQDVIDYGNGWRMAVVKNLNEIVSSGYLTISVPIGAQFEMEHIGAYSGGIANFPNYQSYEPIINTNIDKLENTLNFSGGLLATGDTTKPYVFVSDGSVQNPSTIKSQYCSEQGWDSQLDLASGVTVNTAVGTLLLSLSAEPIKFIGIGAIIKLQQSGVLNEYRVVIRNYDTVGNKFGMNCQVTAVTGTGLDLGAAFAFQDNWKKTPTYTPY